VPGGKRQLSLIVPIAATLLLHIGLAGGIDRAGDWAFEQWKNRPRVSRVEFEVKEEKKDPPKPPPPKKEEKKEEPKKVEEKKVEKVLEKKTPEKKIAKVIEEKEPEPEEEPPAETEPMENEPNEDPDEVYDGEVLKISNNGGTTVRQGTGKGSPKGKKGGTGSGDAGEGGTGKTPVASIASIRDPAMPIGSDSDYMSVKDYPEAARRAGIEGPVTVRLLVDAEGNVVKAELKQGLGYGLDEYALKVAKKLKFKPAIATDGKPVGSWVPWTFRFKLPPA
jgi:protein TonB